jgi:hypothetical protein
MRRRSDLARGHGVTLVELILAILLLNVIILTGLSMEMAVRRVLLSTDYEGQLSSEAGSVVTMVTKKINLAIGTATAPFMSTVVTGVFTTYAFQMDTNNNGIWEPGIDQTRGFRYYTSGVNQYRVYLMRNGVEVRERHGDLKARPGECHQSDQSRSDPRFFRSGARCLAQLIPLDP